jgi:predicted TIM-barrel fold metal-dependent hydrolase
MIVDVDTHWEANRFAPGEHPLQGFEDRLPKPLDRLAFALAGDLLAGLPADRRPDAATLLPHLAGGGIDDQGPPTIHPRHQSTSAERVAWMDTLGIDHALVNPGGYWQMIEFLGADRARAAASCNSYLAAQLADHADRLHAMTIVDFADIDGAVAEMTRMRALGSRGFFLYTQDGKPGGGISPGHPALDPIWAAAVDLGMLAVLHVGNTAASFAGWADIGWDDPRGAGRGGLLRFANVQRSRICELYLNAMLYGGVFARHPDLTVLVAELRTGWMTSFLERAEASSVSSLALGPWPFDRSGGQMLRHNVRFTPLPGFGDTEVLELLEREPEMLVFSSDYPHQEGNPEPIALYQPGLDALDPALRAKFLGDNIAACFARTGNAL